MLGESDRFPTSFGSSLPGGALRTGGSLRFPPLPAACGLLATLRDPGGEKKSSPRRESSTPAWVPRRQLAPAFGDTRRDRHAGPATEAPLQPAPRAGGGPGRVGRVGRSGPLLLPPNLAGSQEAVLVGNQPPPPPSERPIG
ncbi:unnamed protein product [Rangifer tarandus platyrhynchus]|uniref:Uncharacterized protein n=1 Tax=Rangifer tarandus platyrhynchus TaxID=3082113 RepID=A0ABN8XZ72_RANTA|nr:unnamed protein product [Rangifer tarandus platyrhynchus]